MARTAARLPAGSRITDYVSLGVVAKTFPIDTIRAILSATGRGSICERDLPSRSASASSSRPQGPPTQ